MPHPDDDESLATWLDTVRPSFWVAGVWALAIMALLIAAALWAGAKFWGAL